MSAVTYRHDDGHAVRVGDTTRTARLMADSPHWHRVPDDELETDVAEVEATAGTEPVAEPEPEPVAEPEPEPVAEPEPEPEPVAEAPASVWDAEPTSTPKEAQRAGGTRRRRGQARPAPDGD